MRQLASILLVVATSAIHRDEGTDLLLTGQPLHSRYPMTASTGTQVAGMSGTRSSDAIVFIGLNQSASREVQELRRLHNQVTFIGPSKEPDKIQVGQRIYDQAHKRP
jgi:hypothetical protein